MLRNRWRMVGYGTFPLAMNLALDDAISEAVSFNMAGPTIRFYGSDPAAVSIGRAGDIGKEIDEEGCRSSGVDVVRRSTDGVALLHDPGKDLSFSIICSEGMMPEDPGEAYREIGGSVVNALKLIGIEATFEPVNEVAVDGRTICRMIQSRSGKRFMMQGQVLYDLDRPKLFSLIRTRESEIDGIARTEGKITSVRELKKLPWDYIVAALVNALIMNRQWYAGDLTRDEMVRAELIAAQRYANKDWTIGNAP